MSPLSWAFHRIARKPRGLKALRWVARRPVLWRLFPSLLAYRLLGFDEFVREEGVKTDLFKDA